MELLQSMTEASGWPMLTAFLLGLMTAISPCPLATNITATAYLSKDIDIKRQVLFNGLFYTLGRMFTYTALGILFYFGASQFRIASALQGVGGIWLGIALLVIGIFMLDLIRLNLPGVGKMTERIERKKGKKNLLGCISTGTLLRAGVLSLQRDALFRGIDPHDDCLCIGTAPATDIRYRNRAPGDHHRLAAGIQREQYR